jgi:hypothetical protein
MIICRRCGVLSKWQADGVCKACKDTREFPIDVQEAFYKERQKVRDLLHGKVTDTGGCSRR